MPHKLGQVFLIDHNILRKIIQTADIQPKDALLEVGCGKGILSEALANTGCPLSIVELDPKWFTFTQDKLASFDNVSMYAADILDVDPATLPHTPLKMVANIPYYLSAKLIKYLIAHRHHFRDCVLMVQDEFAQKLVALPGTKAYTSLTVHAQFYLKTRLAFRVKKSCFRPIPKVDSHVICVTPRSAPAYDLDEELFFLFVRSVFWGRRKPVLSALTKSPYLKILAPLSDQAPLTPYHNIRGETLSLEALVGLFRCCLGCIARA